MTDTAMTGPAPYAGDPGARARNAASATPLTTADGLPLKAALARSQRRLRMQALFLVLPLLAFILVTFAVPIGLMMIRSVQNPEISEFLPETAAALADWSGEGLPGEPVFAAMARDLAAGQANNTVGRVTSRINREIPGARAFMLGTAREAETLSPPYREAMLGAYEGWGNERYWRLLQRETRTITPAYYLLALDYEYDAGGAIVKRDPTYQVYQPLFLRTAWMSLVITGLTVLLGYPVAFLMANLPMRTANLLMILVLLPFWTSLLVRTSAWIVLLQQEGVINDLLVFAGFIGENGRLRMIYNQTGTIVAMTHVLLPFMILPLYSVMKTIPPSYMRAARSLGANPLRAFLTVYLPMTVPGIAAGTLLVFILAIGYYITPALVGGDSGIFISNLIAQNMSGTGAQVRLAAALSTLLLVGVLLFYWLFNKIVGVDRLKFG